MVLWFVVPGPPGASRKELLMGGSGSSLPTCLGSSQCNANGERSRWGDALGCRLAGTCRCEESLVFACVDLAEPIVQWIPDQRNNVEIRCSMGELRYKSGSHSLNPSPPTGAKRLSDVNVDDGGSAETGLR